MSKTPWEDACEKKKTHERFSIVLAVEFLSDAFR